MLADLFSDYTLRTVALGAAVLGVVGGALGSFAVLRKQSLLGDAISHAALPGVVLAYMLTRSKAPLVLVAGAALAGLAAMAFVMTIVGATRLGYDSALGIVLSVFFGLGLMLLTFVQGSPDANQAGLDRFLFGQAASLVEEDVVAMSAVGAVALLLMAVLWKEFKLLSFDPGYGASLGLPMRVLDLLLTSALVLAIVIGLQTVGVVLMSAMVVAPGAAARQWTDHLAAMVGLAALFGALSGVGGALLSGSTTGLPTGPTIVLLAVAFVIFSLLCAPRRGVLWAAVRRRRSRARLRVRAVLGDLYELAAQHEDPGHAHPVAALEAMSMHSSSVAASLEVLEERGLVGRVGEDRWALTTAGVEQALPERGRDEEAADR